jgi:hypothetical protein
MNLAYRQRRLPAIVIGALAAIAVIAAIVRGSGQTVMVVVLVVTLIAAHVVRHRVRARLLYKRQTASPAAGHPRPADHHHTRTPTSSGR